MPGWASGNFSVDSTDPSYSKGILENLYGFESSFLVTIKLPSFKSKIVLPAEMMVSVVHFNELEFVLNLALHVISAPTLFLKRISKLITRVFIPKLLTNSPFFHSRRSSQSVTLPVATCAMKSKACKSVDLPEPFNPIKQVKPPNSRPVGGNSEFTLGSSGGSVKSTNDLKFSMCNHRTTP